CADRDAAKAGVADPAVHLASGEDGHLLIADETDPAAEVRDHVLTRAEAEREDVVALDEERALPGKEQREPGQIGPARGDFRFGEVGVDGAGGEDVRADALVDVEARLKVPFDVRAGRRNAPAPRHRRPPGGP